MFFEKNGLRHGEFRLPFGPNDVVVESLAWNRDGDALAVCCKERDGGRKSHLLVYTCSNYHWSLKQSWEFPGELLFPASKLTFLVTAVTRMKYPRRSSEQAQG